MSDKKNDDAFGASKMEQFEAERERFIPSSSSQSNARRGAASMGMADSWAKIENNPGVSVIAYCLASISMTVVNKYVVSGNQWNLTFLYLAIQVCPTLPRTPRDSYANRRHRTLYALLPFSSASSLVSSPTSLRLTPRRERDVREEILIEVICA